MKSRTRIIIFIVSAVTVSLGTPLFLDYCIFANNTPSNLTNGEWASFFGSYIGAIVGACISLVGIYFTISFTRAQNNEDRRIQVAPYLNIEFQTTDHLITLSYELDYIVYSPADDDINLFGILTLTNVGLGPMLNCCISDVRFNGNLFPRPLRTINKNALDRGGQYTISIGMYGKNNEVADEHITKYKNPRTGEIEDHFFSDPRDNTGSGILSFYLCYNDIIDTPYQQKISLAVSVSYHKEETGRWRYFPSLSLREILPREKSNSALATRAVPIEVTLDMNNSFQRVSQNETES